jgi:hypothetical protein
MYKGYISNQKEKNMKDIKELKSEQINKQSVRLYSYTDNTFKVIVNEGMWNENSKEVASFDEVVLHSVVMAFSTKGVA